MTGYANRIIAMSDKMMRKKQSRYRKGKKENIHTKNLQQPVVWHLPIQVLTGLALLNFTAVYCSFYMFEGLNVRGREEAGGAGEDGGGGGGGGKGREEGGGRL